MPLLQQTVELLGEAPGNIVYHLVTLLTLQVVIAISRGQWQREPGDAMSRRMTWAAAMIFVARLALLGVGLLISEDTSQAAGFLPPLQFAVHTMTAALIVWALIEHPTRFPRLADTLLLLVLMIIGVLAVIFVDDWQSLAAAGNTYIGSRQATTWSILQVGLLGIGLVLTLASRRLRRTLSPFVIGLLLLAHIANLANTPRVAPVETDIALWIRLGHITAFPLWAALAYRRSLTPLLVARQANRPSAVQLRQSLELSTQVIGATEREEVLNRAVAMVWKMMDAAFVGIALSEENDRNQVRVISNQPQIDQDQPRQWVLNLDAWPPFRLAVEQRQGVHLVPNGLGARQLYHWYEEMGIPPLGALLIQPPTVESSNMRLLILAGPEGYSRWSERDKTLAVALADYVAKLLDLSQSYSEAVSEAVFPPTSGKPDKAVSGRLIALEGERKRLLSELDNTRIRLQRTEEQAAVSEKRARDLAAALQEMENLNREERIVELEEEIESLRESLIEAEEAMALAAAAEGGLSTEWVMLTITRYSGQLEEAQERIQSLEAQLSHWEKGPINEVVASLAQELRTPMTSIAGYTDLLLSKDTGTLGSKKTDFVRRIKANSERMGALLDQIVQLTQATEQLEEPLSTGELANVQEVIETAISAIITQIRDKKLRVDLHIADNLPELAVERSDLSSIVTSLLGNACQATANNGVVSITAQADSMSDSNPNGQSGPIDYVKLSVTDGGGGISADDWSRVFDPQHRADHPLIAGLGDTGAGLSMARKLTEANGGRIWVDSKVGVGSTFSTFFPVVPAHSENLSEESEAPADPVTGKPNGA